MVFSSFVLCFDCPAIMLRRELVGDNKQVGGMRGGSWGLKACLGAVLFFGIIWLLFIGILVNHATTTTTTTTTTTRTVTVPSTEIFRHWKFIQREKLHVHQDFDLHYVSKRRIPNGPDPIHNRRAVKSRQPPGKI